MSRDHFSKENSMPKKDSLDESESDIQEQTAKENSMPKKDDKSVALQSTDGLVLLSKGDEKLHVHPSTVKAHMSAGWKVH
jgi:hypothetical protein